MEKKIERYISKLNTRMTILVRPILCFALTKLRLRNINGVPLVIQARRGKHEKISRK